MQFHNTIQPGMGMGGGGHRFLKTLWADTVERLYPPRGGGRIQSGNRIRPGALCGYNRGNCIRPIVGRLSFETGVLLLLLAPPYGSARVVRPSWGIRPSPLRPSCGDPPGPLDDITLGP